MLADESPLLSKAQLHKSRIADDDSLQAQQFIQFDGPPARLADSAAPSLDTVMRGTFSFDGIARFGVLQQQECCCPRKNIFWHVGDNVLRASYEIHSRELL